MADPITPLTPAQVTNQEARASREGYLHRTLVGLDQFTNVLTGGNPDETISSRLARSAEQDHTVGKVGSAILNLFQKDHGPKAQAGDAERAERIETIEEQSGGLQ
jgi:hypothetical protein